LRPPCSTAPACATSRCSQLTIVSALVVSLAMTKVWQLMLLWGVVIGIGTGMTAMPR
jgi:uncharacterized membrane protein